MSFGEHLDELRVALFKSLIALTIGVLVGFGFARQVVIFIQSPLDAGLASFRRLEAREQFKKELDQRRAAGLAVSDEEMDELLEYADRGLAPKRYLIDPKRAAEAGLTVSEKVKLDGAGMIPLTLFESIEGDPRDNPIETNVQGPFFIWCKAALLVGAVASSPAVFYFLWAFVASGLYKHERGYVYIFMPFSIALFLLGAGVAFFFVFKFVLEFLFGFYAWLDINPMPRVSEWLNFALLLPLCFGVGFQLPLVMLFLERIGVFTATNYLHYWRWAVMVIFIVSMVVSPGGDPYSMLFMAVPLTALYFGGIGLCRFMPRRKTAFGEPVG